MAYPIDGTEWEFWALTNTKAGEWTKLFRIDLDYRKSPLASVLSGGISDILIPIALLISRDLLILQNDSSGIYVAYNVKTRQILRSWKLGKRRDCFGDNLDIHVNSLVALKMLVKNIEV